MLAGKKVAILAADGFEEVELVDPLRALDGHGASTSVISPSERWVKAWNRRDWGSEFPVATPLPEARAEEYDALFLPGGVLSPDLLRQREDARAFVRSFFDARKPVAAICHGPQVLIDAEVVNGRKLTSYPSIRRDLENAGALWVDEVVVSDGNLLTSRSPDDLPPFIDRMIEHFSRGRIQAAREPGIEARRPH
jgi:protease I